MPKGSTPPPPPCPVCGRAVGATRRGRLRARHFGEHYAVSHGVYTGNVCAGANVPVDLDLRAVHEHHARRHDRLAALFEGMPPADDPEIARNRAEEVARHRERAERHRAEAARA